MTRIDVLVAAITPDIKAEFVAAAVAARPDMTLLQGRVVTVSEADDLVPSIFRSPRCAVVLIGSPPEADAVAERWLEARTGLVVLTVDAVDEIVRVALRNPGLQSLISALRGLVERVETEPEQRLARVQLRAGGSATDVEPADPDGAPIERPLLRASVSWIHARLRQAVDGVSDENGDVHGLSVTRATLLQVLDGPAELLFAQGLEGAAAADATLDHAVAEADPATEPLAALMQGLQLRPLEFRMLLLALAPELDHRFQRAIGFLLDEMGRRVGTAGLYSALLGDPATVRVALASGGSLERWKLLESEAGRPIASDEPLRLDPHLVHWLLGQAAALATDPRLRRALRLAPWPGASLLKRPAEFRSAVDLIRTLVAPESATAERSHWMVFADDQPSGWRALLELGADASGVAPVRVEAERIIGAHALEIEDCALLIARMARVARAPLFIDATHSRDADPRDDALRVFLTTLDEAGCRAAVVSDDGARIVRLLSAANLHLHESDPLPAAARVEAVRVAARGADAYVSEETARAFVGQHPIQVDGLEQAMHLARRREIDHQLDDSRVARFLAACRQVAAEGGSQLAQRIEPLFGLDDVVLPPDRMGQLMEIVDHVRLAPWVLDEWKFGDQLPYGRGVSALFFGWSGTGKTMAAMGIARRLGIQLLRIDLSRVVSKYIGDTEKNIDRVFVDAQRSGAALLIDEADALFGKRSEVKDAHDRYANIEVAYLLQRMEAYEGLAILTTNLRQNIDPAFLRRLRFIVDFPRPDVEARERIWRNCLPEDAHALDDSTFRLLARRIDLTGGHIRQITLRAAFIAASGGVRIGLEHIAHAARAELAKLGMPPTAVDSIREREAA